MKNYYLEEVVDEIYYKECKENRELKMDILSLKIKNELNIIEIDSNYISLLIIFNI